MSRTRLDSVARRLAGSGTRRRLLSAGAGLVCTMVMGTPRHGYGAAAAEGPPPPPPDRELWPPCSDERTQYCIAEFLVDGVDQLNLQEPDYSLDAFRLKPGDGPEDPAMLRPLWILNRLQHGLQQPLQDVDLESEIELRLRLGQLHPTLVTQTSGISFIQVTGNATDGWELVSRGSPALFSFPGEDEHATAAWVMFQGEGYQRAEWPSEGFEPFKGAITSSAFSDYPIWEDDAWKVRLYAPHFLPDGSVRHGSYSAWISPETLLDLELSLEAALAGELSITREDAGVGSPVEASLTARDGGVYVEVLDLTFSSPAIVMKKRAKPVPTNPPSPGGCDPKCRKGHVCRNGRCKKKRKKHGKH